MRSAEVAGPGFLNFRLTTDWLTGALRDVAARGSVRPGRPDRPARAGRVRERQPDRAAPRRPRAQRRARGRAGPRARGAGWSVEREYYFNDAGGQMDRFGASVEARYLAAAGPRRPRCPRTATTATTSSTSPATSSTTEGPGLADLPRRARRAAPARGRAGVARADRGDARAVRRALRHLLLGGRAGGARARSTAAVERLRDAGYAYEADGAVWFRSTAFGDDKDRVLVRSNGDAHVLRRRLRVRDRQVRARVRPPHLRVGRRPPRRRRPGEGRGAGAGLRPRRASRSLIYQFVSFLRDGEPVPMSKRAGTFVTLDELIDEVGTDAARFTC